jgi:transposase
MEIKILRKQGENIRGIARQLGISRNTASEYLRNDKSASYTARPKQGSKLEPYKPYIQQRIASAEPH